MNQCYQKTNYTSKYCLIWLSETVLFQWSFHFVKIIISLHVYWREQVSTHLCIPNVLIFDILSCIINKINFCRNYLWIFRNVPKTTTTKFQYELNLYQFAFFQLDSDKKWQTKLKRSHFSLFYWWSHVFDVTLFFYSKYLTKLVFTSNFPDGRSYFYPT